MPSVVIHNYVEPDLKNLPKNENADCSKCIFAEKQYSQSEPNEDCAEYLCKAALYDINTLACYVPKEN